MVLRKTNDKGDYLLDDYLENNRDDIKRDSITPSEKELLIQIAYIVENRKNRASMYANSEVTLMFWEIGNSINKVVLHSQRATYGKKIVATVSTQLTVKYGKSFELTNIRRMMRFAERFDDYEIVATLSPQLSQSTKDKWNFILNG